MNTSRHSLLALALLASSAVANTPPAESKLERLKLLQASPSLYVRRASRQPVDWYPWGDEAFARARALDRPILLDVGATWCEWCARMDRGSYVKPETAAFLNSHFVAVKVDYEENPAFSARLERAQAVLNLAAGLPLTAFVTPSGKLYFGGGYLPAEAAHGRPAFRQTLDDALRMFNNRRAEIERDAEDVRHGE